jgi:hypothetical protein
MSGAGKLTGQVIEWESGAITQVMFRRLTFVVFSPSLIEVRQLETGQLLQVLPGAHISCLPHAHDDVGISFPRMHVALAPGDAKPQNTEHGAWQVVYELREVS